MSRQIKVTFSDAVFAAIERQAVHDGQMGGGNGPQTVVRKAVRYWLNKMGCSATELDISDAEYQTAIKIASGALPGTRNDTLQVVYHDIHDASGA